MVYQQLHDKIPPSYFVGVVSAALLIDIIINIFFSWTCYRTLSTVPKDKQTIPAWVCWLMIAPVVRVIFYWIILPFAIPNSLKKAFSENTELVKATRSLFGIGLAFVILATLSFVPLVGIVFIAAIVLYIIYWIKVADIKKYIP